MWGEDAEIDGVYLRFYNVTLDTTFQQKKGWVHYFIGDWTHVEIIFRMIHPRKVYYTLQVLPNRFIEFQKINLTHPSWLYRSLETTAEETQKLWRFCCLQRGKECSSATMWLSHIMWLCFHHHTTSEDPQSWDAAELTYAALERSGVLERLIGYGTPGYRGIEGTDDCAHNPGSVTYAMLVDMLEHVTGPVLARGRGRMQFELVASGDDLPMQTIVESRRTLTELEAPSTETKKER